MEYIRILIFVWCNVRCVIAGCDLYTAELKNKWITIEYEWPNETMKQKYIQDGDYIPDNNAINGIKIYNGSVYMTIPRLKSGVAATLAFLTEPSSISSTLTPYPSWDMHKFGDCNTLQLVQSMEIDPNTGWMWILDTSYVPVGGLEVSKPCPAKIIIWDLETNTEIRRYIFPKELLGNPFYLNDLVLDFIDGTARFAYISDTLGWKLVVYDFAKNNAYKFQHESMRPDPVFKTITISGDTTMVPLGINGIAMASDFQYVYYSAVSSLSLYQIPTNVLRNSAAGDGLFASRMRYVGNKTVQSDGLYYGKKSNLYFSTLGKNAVYKWSIGEDARKQGSFADVKMVSQTEVSADPMMQWIDSLAIDEHGYLWFTSNNLHKYFTNDTNPGTWNYFVWRTYIDDMSYMFEPNEVNDYQSKCDNSAADGEVSPILVYKWTAVDFVWPNCSMKRKWLDDKQFILENNIINGIKTFQNRVFLTIPRLKDGVVSSLVEIVPDGTDSPALKPYPSWEMNTRGDCNHLQLVQSIEIDPNTGYMWILDTAYVPKGNVEVANSCRPKLVIYDIVNDKEIHRHIFPKIVTDFRFYLNDLVLDYVNNTARYAYISDTLGWKLIVYDHKLNYSYSFTNPSMNPDPAHATLTISGFSSEVTPLGINGIAMSDDFKYVYYSSVAGTKLYQIPTFVLRDYNSGYQEFLSNMRYVGNKTVQGDGMLYGTSGNLYFSTLGKNSVFRWNARADAKQTGSFKNVTLKTRVKLVKDCRMQWIDSLAVDNKGYIWFTSNNLHTFFGNVSEPATYNMFVWKAKINDKSYLDFSPDVIPVSAARTLVVFKALLIMTLICEYFAV